MKYNPIPDPEDKNANYQGEQELESLTINNKTVEIQQQSNKRYLYDYVVSFLIIILTIGCIYELGQFIHNRSQKYVQQQTNSPVQEVELTIPSIKHYTDFYRDELPELIQQKKFEMSTKTKQRAQMGQPSPQPRFLSLYTITKTNPKHKKTCGCLNGILVLTAKSALSTLKLFDSGMQKMMIFVDRNDKFADELIQKYFNESLQLKYEKINITVDADYQFLRGFQQCNSIIYLQNYFQINSQDAATTLITKLTQLQPYHMQYPKKCTIKSKQAILPNLQEINLSTLNGSQLTQYLLIFDPALLRILGPLNFAYYNKYTLQELIIYPLLAVVQKSEYLEGFQESLYGFDESFEQFKEFGLKPARSITQEMRPEFCFVSYPTLPESINPQQLETYIKSIKQLTFTNPISLIIFLPYNQHYPQLNTLKYLIKLLEQTRSSQQLSQKIHRIRIILKHEKSVSSLSVYQSAYTYCPTKSLITSSRHNINFHPNFTKSLSNQYSSKYHYYFVGYQLANYHDNLDSSQNTQIRLQVDSLKFPTQRYEFRNNALYYREYFRDVQIFKGDLFRMIYFQMLKSDQIDFYHSQASFVLPMLQMIKLNICIINEIQYTVTQRPQTPQQQTDLTNLKKYFQMVQIPNNILNPYPLSSLSNIAFRRTAPNKIPKILHQAWIGNKQSTQFREQLHASLLKTNKQYRVMLWKEENLTVEGFPIAHSLIHRSLQYQRSSKRSLLAPIVSLIRYEALLHHGGIYLDYKTQGLKPLDPFLKYQIFFTDATITQQRYGNPNYLGNPIMGAQPNSYYLNFVLTELITQQRINYHEIMFPKIVGAYVLRKAFNTKQVFSNVGFGFHLFSPRPALQEDSQEEESLCLRVKEFSNDQVVYDVENTRNNKNYKVGLPCRQYPEAYVLQYRPLGRTWVI